MFVSNALFAQTDPVTIEVELSRSRVYVGDDLTYQVIVRGAENPPPPEVEFPSGVRAGYNGRSSHSFTTMRIINGRRQSVTDQRFSFQYTLTAIESGSIAIPSPKITINGQTITGQEISFDSALPTKSDSDEILITIERESIYLNETVEAECTWWIGNQTSDFSFASTMIPSTFQISPLEPPPGGQQTVRVIMNGEALIGVVMPGRHFGQDMTKLVFRFSVTPQEAGSFLLGPIRAVFTRHSGTGQNYRAYIESDSIPVVVKHVPIDGRPNGYAGAIGAYRVFTKASNSIVNVGDPIQLIYRVEGKEPMVGLNDAPNLAHLRGFKASSDGWRETLPKRSGIREFTTTIRAINAQVDEIPPIGFPSFHPETTSYQSYQSRPIPIVVQAVDVVTLSDAIVTGGLSVPNTSSSWEHIELTPLQPGLWAHGAASEILQENSFSYANLVRSPTVIAVAASGPVLFSITMLIGFVRNREHQQRRVLCRAYAHGRRLEKQGRTHESLCHYLAIALDMNPDSVAANDAFLLPINDECAQSTSQALSHGEAESCLNSSKNQETTPAVSSNLLRDIHTQVLHHRVEHT